MPRSRSGRPARAHATVTTRSAHAAASVARTDTSSFVKRAAASGSSLRTSSLPTNSGSRNAQVRCSSPSSITTSPTTASRACHASTSSLNCAT